MWPLGTEFRFGVLMVLLGWDWLLLEGSSSPEDSMIL